MVLLGGSWNESALLRCIFNCRLAHASSGCFKSRFFTHVQRTAGSDRCVIHIVLGQMHALVGP